MLFNQLLGAVPAPPLYGLAVDWLEKDVDEETSHRVAQSFAAVLLILSSVVLLYARFISPRHPDYKRENGE